MALVAVRSEVRSAVTKLPSTYFNSSGSVISNCTPTSGSILLTLIGTSTISSQIPLASPRCNSFTEYGMAVSVTSFLPLMASLSMVMCAVKLHAYCTGA